LSKQRVYQRKEIIKETIDNFVSGNPNSWLRKGKFFDFAFNEVREMFSQLQEERQATYTFRYKTWVTMLDERVRDSHLEMEGKTVKISDDFVLPTGAHCSHPRDKSLPISESINCRCVCHYHN